MRLRSIARAGACACVFALSLMAIVRLEAIYVLPDIESVPVERLIRNMEQIVSKEPKNAPLRFNLARVHAMAFALKMSSTETVRIVRGREAAGLWFEPDVAEVVPFKALPTADTGRLNEAKEHIAKAIEIYREGIELDPNNLAAKLGYAWSLDQSGDKGRAVTAYRHVIAEAWAVEQGVIRPMQVGTSTVLRVSAGPGFRSVTTEAATYLIPLLDREKDRDEIATLQERIGYVLSLPRGVTPIAIPLRDGLQVSDLIDPKARVRFDADGSGLRHEWSWITPNAGWLVHAPEGSRPIHSALQMFGSVTFWMFWDNGYQALRALDDNDDGVLKAAELKGLAIWRDSNMNGIAEDGEVKPLPSWGIQSLSWKHEANRTRDDYVAFSPAGVTFEDGHARPTWDVLLHPRLDAAVETE